MTADLYEYFWSIHLHHVCQLQTDKGTLLHCTVKNPSKNKLMPEPSNDIASYGYMHGNSIIKTNQTCLGIYSTRTHFT
jgi:hypothetical protein